MMPRGAGTTASAAPRIDQGAMPPDSGGAGPALGPERAIPRCAEFPDHGGLVPLEPNTHHQSFFTTRRENSASARAALNRIKGLHLAATLLRPGVDASRPISNLEKEVAHVFSQWPCQAQ
jgi:hypothetical protein